MRPAEVVIVGGGIVGINAATVAAGMGAQVTILERSAPRMRYLEEVMNGRVTTLTSQPRNLADSLRAADVLIGGVLIPGARAPKLVSRDMIRAMRPGSVAVDVAIDQGGCFETSRPTSHSDPVYVEEGVIHYCVTNMPGAVPRTSTFALSHATLPYALDLANRGFPAALEADPALARGLNTHAGQVAHPGVAEAHGLPCRPFGG